MISSLLAVFSLAVSFTVGWLVATDKNRNELFKQKLESYKKVSAQVAKVYTVGVALENIQDSEIDNKTRENLYRKEATTLLNMTFSEMLFLDKAVYEQVFKVIQMKPSEYSKNKEEIKKAIDSLRENLNLQKLNKINQLLTLPLDITALPTSVKKRFYKEK